MVGAFGFGERNEGGGRIIDYGLLNGLRIINTFFKHRDSHKWTYYGWNSEEQQYVSISMLDQFLTSDKRVLKNVRAVPSMSMNSTHRMVMATLAWRTEKLPKKKGKQIFNVEKLRDSKTADAMREVINNKIVKAESRDWKTSEKIVTSSAADTLGSKKSYQGGRRPHLGGQKK